MTIRYRPLRYDDISACVEIFARHPILARRYGETIARLGEVWAKIMGQLAFTSIIFEESNGADFRKVALGTRAFLSDEFVKEMKTPPYYWAGPEIVRRVLAGRSPLLTDKQVREANTAGGLNLFVWDGTACASDLGRPEVIHTVFVEFIDQHRGFFLKELISQSSSPDILEAQLQSGGFLLDNKGEYTNMLPKPAKEIVSAPHYLGVSRNMAIRHYGSWVSSMFIYHPPRFGFRPSEQRLLLAALDGGTDEQIAEKLEISVSAVKKTWQLVYTRVSARDPKLIPDPRWEGQVRDHPERGKTKKQQLLAFLREHIEELRPLASRV